MSDNMLKKEFNKRDVQRMRNIITKDYSAKTATQVGYTKEHVEHKEGDVWEENGKQWTIKNGIKQTVTRLDKLKKIIVMPLTCPTCHKPMKNNPLNKKMWSIHSKCFDCVIKHETELKRLGKFDEYQQNINKQSLVYHIKEMENVLLELAMQHHGESYVTEAGDVEEWKGKGLDTKTLIQDIQEYIQKLKGIVNS